MEVGAPSSPLGRLLACACQAGWVSGASWKTLATQAPVLAVASARVQWWQALPDSPVAVPVASEAQTAPCQTPASAALVLMVPAAQWGQMAALSAPVHLATRVEVVEVMSMSAERVDPAATVVPASTLLAPSAANVRLATRGFCVRTPQCPVPLPHVVMVALVGRVVIRLMTVLVFLVLRARIVRSMWMTVLDIGVSMGERVWMVSTLTTASALLSGQASSAQRM